MPAPCHSELVEESLQRGPVYRYLSFSSDRSFFTFAQYDAPLLLRFPCLHTLLRYSCGYKQTIDAFSPWKRALGGGEMPRPMTISFNRPGVRGMNIRLESREDSGKETIVRRPGRLPAIKSGGGRCRGVIRTAEICDNAKVKRLDTGFFEHQMGYTIRRSFHKFNRCFFHH